MFKRKIKTIASIFMVLFIMLTIFGCGAVKEKEVKNKKYRNLSETVIDFVKYNKDNLIYVDLSDTFGLCIYSKTNDFKDHNGKPYPYQFDINKIDKIYRFSKSKGQLPTFISNEDKGMLKKELNKIIPNMIFIPEKNISEIDEMFKICGIYININDIDYIFSDYRNDNISNYYINTKFNTSTRCYIDEEMKKVLLKHNIKFVKK